MFQSLSTKSALFFVYVLIVSFNNLSNYGIYAGTSSIHIGNYTVSAEAKAEADPMNKKTVTRFCDPENCPFDDLSENEIKKVFTIVAASGKFPSDIIYAIVRKQEPKKQDWISGNTLNSREAYAALFNVGTNTITEIVINLKTAKIISSKDQPKGVTPYFLKLEQKQVEDIIRASTDWRAAVERRGVDPDQTTFDIWAPGPPLNLAEATDAPNKRLLRAITSYKDPNDWSSYWHPIEGLTVTVDLAAGKIFSIWDNGVITPIAPTIPFESVDNKPPLKPLEISQPEGSSISIVGHQVSWYKWTFQYSVDPIFGLQFYHIRYTADCEDRMVLYSFRLADIFVPYGEDDKNWAWRNAFDVGEYGLGKTASSLEIGLDLPENALTRDCVFANELGTQEPLHVPNCVGFYERDIGFLYKHTDSDTGEKKGKRGREMVATFMTTIGNYDYTFDLAFSMDGSMKVTIRLTGIILAKGDSSPFNEDHCYGPVANHCKNLLGEYLLGPTHQHFYNFRMDFDIDGVANYVEEHNVVKVSRGGDEDNPYGGAVKVTKDIKRKEGFSDHSFRHHREWAVVNPTSKNEFNTPRGYAIKRQDVSFTYLNEDSLLAKKAHFITHPIWWTRYKDDEQTAAYRFPRTGPPGGVFDDVDDEYIISTDIVIWHTTGVTHKPRAEEWPIMTPHDVSFKIVPINFLSRNAEMPIKDRCEL